MPPLKTHVYIDGFNLFYGLLKKSPYKWLNLECLCQSYLDLSKNDIISIKYFTALVVPRKNDPHQNSRQQTYLKALKTLSKVEIIYGHFLSHTVSMPRADGSGYVDVIKTEEKKSDVNIASHMLHDAYTDKYDLAVLISNDSDLSEPLRIITQDMGKLAAILNPQKNRSKELSKYALFYKKIRQGSLSKCQFPDIVSDKNVTIVKPKDW